jgi:site-specific recombinase XerD
MNTRINYGFILKKEANKKGLYPVYLRAFKKGRKTEISTSIAIHESEWSSLKQRVKKINSSHVRHNSILDAFEKKALKLVLDNFINGGSLLTLSDFKNSMLSLGQSDESFTDYVLHYLTENRARFKKETWWSYKSQVTKLMKFRKSILFSDINEKFITDYQYYMLNVLENNENTVSKSLRSLRTFVNISMRYGYIKQNPFQYVTIKKVDGKRDFLSAEELNSLTAAYFKNELEDTKHTSILQYFLFACYTGLRYSDIKSLKKSSIRDSTLHIKMHKTGYTVTIPLTKKAHSLIPTMTADSDLVFKVYCNKVTNRVLKQIGEKYQIQKKLTCHVARHTFATVSITLGIPIEVVSKLLGHTNLKTTQVYAKIVDSVKQREMEKWDSL